MDKKLGGAANKELFQGYNHKRVSPEKCLI